MDAVKQQRIKFEYTKYVQSLKDEHYLDDQFQQLVQLVDDSTPNFVREVVHLFFEDSVKLINELDRAIYQQSTDFNVVAANVHQLKGSSSSIGAKRVRSVCVDFRNYCEARNYEGCSMILQKLKQECSFVQHKLQELFQMEDEFVAAGGSLSNLHKGSFT